MRYFIFISCSVGFSCKPRALSESPLFLTTLGILQLFLLGGDAIFFAMVGFEYSALEDLLVAVVVAL